MDRFTWAKLIVEQLEWAFLVFGAGVVAYFACENEAHYRFMVLFMLALITWKVTRRV